MREHEPTELNRAKVVGLACNGATQARIAQHLGITEKTLRLHYGHRVAFACPANKCLRQRRYFARHQSFEHWLAADNAEFFVKRLPPGRYGIG